MIRYLITDGTAARNERFWLDHAAFWLERGVDFIQLRERELNARELARLTRKVVGLARGKQTKVLVNDRADVALACGAHGVHLRDGSVLPVKYAGTMLVSVACHRVSEIPQLCGADLILLSPIFEPVSKTSAAPPLGVEAIRQAVLLTAIPVLALGGVTTRNEHACQAAGAAGLAGIGYFARN